MAKQQAIVETAGTNVPGVPDDVMARIKTDAGGGLSKDQADNLVPLIYLLQPMSPQAMKGKPEKIEGAEPGDIWLRNSEHPIIKGENGMVFQPCYFYKDLVEWIPDRGGFVGRHDISCMANRASNKPWSGTLKDVREITDPENPNAMPRYVRSSNNNEIVETRYFVGYVYPDDGGTPMPFIIPLASTGHAFGKQWMALQNSQTLKDGSSIDKSWVVLYRLKTTMKTNAYGSWYMYTVAKERLVKDMTEYERGAALNAAFASGQKVADDMDAGFTASGNKAPITGDFNNEEEQ